MKRAATVVTIVVIELTALAVASATGAGVLVWVWFAFVGVMERCLPLQAASRWPHFYEGMPSRWSFATYHLDQTHHAYAGSAEDDRHVELLHRQPTFNEGFWWIFDQDNRAWYERDGQWHPAYRRADGRWYVKPEQAA